ncbi:MAG: hypothetical protein D3925_07620 [Candidatus Electrothrix sp. AR5]|nr:hypothetical protein [Candidatus Electrothrix sp. AR5]
MSRQGAKSDQGDDYQRFIALHWIIRLISDDEIEYVQAQSTGLPGVDEKITVDDIVVCYNNGQRRHIQAKKNQPANRCWNLTDLQDELPKILEQLASCPQAIVGLYSCIPFGGKRSLPLVNLDYFERNHLIFLSRSQNMGGGNGYLPIVKKFSRY